VLVAVVKQIPVDRIQMLLGNDLAGEKVKANPRVSAEPKIAGDTEFESQENPRFITPVW